MRHVFLAISLSFLIPFSFLSVSHMEEGDLLPVDGLVDHDLARRAVYGENSQRLLCDAGARDTEHVVVIQFFYPVVEHLKKHKSGPSDRGSLGPGTRPTVWYTLLHYNHLTRSQSGKVHNTDCKQMDVVMRFYWSMSKK